ncbi:MAG: hypothetical protein ACLURV_07390 [Gallintestinimicrobium sp.]
MLADNRVSLISVIRQQIRDPNAVIAPCNKPDCQKRPFKKEWKNYRHRKPKAMSIWKPEKFTGRAGRHQVDEDYKRCIV